MDIGKEKALDLLVAMLKGRMFDESIMELFTQGFIPGFIHVGLGQEAVAAGVCRNLRKDDYISITHRGHSQIVAKGVDLKRAMAELFGKEAGFCRGKAGSMHVADSSIGIIGASGIVGAATPIATGAAFSAKYRGTDQVAVCFFGDGASNQGTFHEALNMASLWKLPIIYCCENNSWAQFTNQPTVTKVTEIASKAAAYGMPGIKVDGTDVLAVNDAAITAIERARSGGGPTLLECMVNRWHGHYVGDPQKYRDPEDLEKARKQDPITKFEKKLLKDKIISAEEIEATRKQVAAEIAEAIEFAKQTPEPAPEEALQDVYSA